MTQKILTVSFYLLFAITPLVWAPWNFELFEYNKMVFVYLLTVIIISCWLVKMVQTRKIIISKTPLDIPLLLFLLANILSTIFSIDPHTSLFGYYSRSNGGLFSTISYILLYYALVSNFTAADAIRFIKGALIGGLVVALYAVPEHFGASPSCFLLRGEFTSDCWIQDVTARVFATLGQPNWLAAYLAILIFPALYFVLTSSRFSSTIYYILLTTVLYLSFTFTYSRGATLGLIAGLLVMLGSLWLHPKGVRSKTLIVFLLIILLINLVFGSALTNFKLLNKFSPPPRPAVTTQTTSSALETGKGDETGQIRLVVWQGALDIFRHNPIFGSGVETFAYSYYQFRPAAHNLTAEWDFLYNKAHNEFLNYLATTGLVGFITYMLIVGTFIFWCISRIFNFQFSIFNKNFKFQILNSKTAEPNLLLVISILASYISYLVQNFFGFSVVTTALFFFLFPALTFLFTDSVSSLKLSSSRYSILSTLYSILYSRPFYPKLLTVVIIIPALLLVISLGRFYLADTYYSDGERSSETGKAGQAYNSLSYAVSLNPHEPIYLSELGFAGAAASVALAEEDASSSAILAEEAILNTNQSLSASPKNVSLLRTAVRTYYLLTSLDKKYFTQALELLDQTIDLSPTDPKLLYNKALILSAENKNSEAVHLLFKTIQLKPNYKEARLSLVSIYQEMGKKEEAKKELNNILQIFPQDPEALEKLKELGK